MNSTRIIFKNIRFRIVIDMKKTFIFKKIYKRETDNLNNIYYTWENCTPQTSVEGRGGGVEGGGPSLFREKINRNEYYAAMHAKACQVSCQL